MMRKFLAVYLVFATVLLGTVSAIGNTIDLSAVAKMTRAKQIAKQEKVDFVVKTLALKPVNDALQKAGVRLKENDIKDLVAFAPPQKLDLLYSQCVMVEKSLALGQYGGGGGGIATMWIIIAVVVIVLIVVLLVALRGNTDPYHYYYY